MDDALRIRLGETLREHEEVAARLVARDGVILYEHYQYGRTDADRFLSYSMAKTVTGMLIGIAVREGAIRSIDQRAADYVPELAGTEYGGTSIRDLLRMASGVAAFASQGKSTSFWPGPFCLSCSNHATNASAS